MTDLECLRCGGQLGHLTCEDCGARYQEVRGIPFFGEYERADVLGLIEIATHVALQDTSPMSPEVVRRVDSLCAGYHCAQDKEEFVKSNTEAAAWYFPARYTEWLSFNRLIEGIDLTGRRVLDVGAGLGFDSQRLAFNGADVTALEFAPNLAEAGRKGFPHLRWIGGFSHVLPFRTASFDAVFFNAALHHMRDIPTSISEALRVLRPGGTLITTGDPFRADHQSIAFEFETYDKHKFVLLGINEQIPRFSDLVQVLEQNADFVAVDVFTIGLHDPVTGSTTSDLARWDLASDGRMLRGCHGTLGMRVKLLKLWPHKRNKQTAGILSAANFNDWLNDQSGAIARLAAIIPADHVNLPFPGEQTKFSLLNGWRLPSKDSDARTAYQRARWFLTRRGADSLTFQIRSPVRTTFTILINNETACRLCAATEWTPVTLDLSGIDSRAPFVVEIRRDEEEADFESACFQVRDQRFDRNLLFVSGDNQGVPLARRVDYLRAELEALRTQVHAAEEKAERYRAELETLRAQVHVSEEKAERYRAEADALQASTSWRITGPLRGLRRLLS
jgi:SAM-dependent methyltransferase